MHSYYEINVALNGKHYFATNERSITSVTDLEPILKTFFQKFPDSEGFSVTVTHWDCFGQRMLFPALKAHALQEQGKGTGVLT